VLPRLRPIWDAEGWENHWWPRGQRAAGAAGPPADAAAASSVGAEA
jgi:hypothetical protein